MKLSAKESVVIRLRYGIGIGDCMTYAEIAEVVAISQTMVRQLEHRAMRKLRHPTNREALMEMQESIAMINTERSRRYQ